MEQLLKTASRSLLYLLNQTCHLDARGVQLQILSMTPHDYLVDHLGDAAVGEVKLLLGGALV